MSDNNTLADLLLNIHERGPDSPTVVDSARCMRAMAEALRLLVHLKDHKEVHGRDEHYLAHKDGAWQAAKDALALYYGSDSHEQE